MCAYGWESHVICWSLQLPAYLISNSWESEWTVTGATSAVRHNISKSQYILRKSFHGHLAMWNASVVDLWQCFQTQMEIGDTPYVVEVWENLSRVYSLAQPSPGPPPPSLSRLSLCLFEPASHSHRPSLIIEGGLPVSWAAPSLPRPHHWLPVPQAGEAHLALQPWLRAQALLGMDAQNLQASLVNPAFFYSLSPVYVWCTASHSTIRWPACHK